MPSAAGPRRFDLGQITSPGPPEAFTSDLHEQVNAWLGINF
jgi:hypothetical protein